MPKEKIVAVGKGGYGILFHAKERNRFMKPENIEKINRSFELQAPNFESKSLNFTKEEYLNYTISCVAPCRENTLLEVAAGTCACGRSFAPLVRTVVCLDATVPMLRIGQQEADKEHLSNMVFVKGYAEELSFLDNCFTTTEDLAAVSLIMRKLWTFSLTISNPSALISGIS